MAPTPFPSPFGGRVGHGRLPWRAACRCGGRGGPPQAGGGEREQGKESRGMGEPGWFFETEKGERAPPALLLHSPASDCVPTPPPPPFLPNLFTLFSPYLLALI